MNVEKEKEQLIIDLKSCQKRLENEKARSDTSQVSLTQKELELQRSKDVLSAANKQIKMLDQKLMVVKDKKRRLKEVLKEYANIKTAPTSPPKLPSLKQ
jgi:chromosome segregation ATPase